MRTICLAFWALVVKVLTGRSWVLPPFMSPSSWYNIVTLANSQDPVVRDAVTEALKRRTVTEEEEDDEE